MRRRLQRAIAGGDRADVQERDLVAGIAASGVNSSNFEVTTLNPAHGGNFGRIIQIVPRFDW